MARRVSGPELQAAHKKRISILDPHVDVGGGAETMGGHRRSTRRSEGFGSPRNGRRACGCR